MVEQPRCNICGGTAFGPGPGGRKSISGALPFCLGCHSLERHRIVRKVYSSMPKWFLARLSALQFSRDPSIDPHWFRSFETSIYGGTNSLDLEDIARNDASYDFVICNHVLEHISDDCRAFRELLRIVGPTGIVQITVPDPVTHLHTRDWGYPREDAHGHYRLYGADFVKRFRRAVDQVELCEVSASDDVTGVRDIVYFWSQDRNAIDSLRQWFERPHEALSSPLEKRDGRRSS